MREPYPNEERGQALPNLEVIAVLVMIRTPLARDVRSPHAHAVALTPSKRFR